MNIRRENEIELIKNTPPLHVSTQCDNLLYFLFPFDHQINATFSCYGQYRICSFDLRGIQQRHAEFSSIYLFESDLFRQLNFLYNLDCFS